MRRLEGAARYFMITPGGFSTHLVQITNIASP